MRAWYEIPEVAYLYLSKYRYKIYSIDMLYVEPRERGKGYARYLMNMVIDDAESSGVTLRLIVAPTGELTFKELCAFYSRCGFVRNRHSIMDYIRVPKRAVVCDGGLVRRQKQGKLLIPLQDKQQNRMPELQLDMSTVNNSS